MPESGSQRCALLELAGARRIDFGAAVTVARKIEADPERAVALAGIAALRRDRALYQEALKVPMSNFDRRDRMGRMIEAANILGPEAVESLVDITVNAVEDEWRNAVLQALITALSCADIRLPECSLDKLLKLGLDPWTRGQLILDQGVKESAAKSLISPKKSIVIGFAESLLLNWASDQSGPPLSALEETLGDLGPEIGFAFDWYKWTCAPSTEHGTAQLLERLLTTAKVEAVMPVLDTIASQAWGKSKEHVRKWRSRVFPWAAHIAACGPIEAYREDRGEWIDFAESAINRIDPQARVPPPTQAHAKAVRDNEEAPSARVKASLRVAEVLRESSPEKTKRFLNLAYESAIKIEGGKGAYPETELLAITFASELLAPDLTTTFAQQAFARLRAHEPWTSPFEDRLLEVLTERPSKGFNRDIERSEIRIQAWKAALYCSRKGVMAHGFTWTALCWLARFGELTMDELERWSRKLKDTEDYGDPKLWVLYRCTEAWLNHSSKEPSLCELIDLEEKHGLFGEEQKALTAALTNYPNLEKDRKLLSDLVSRVHTKSAAIAAVERCINVDTFSVLCEHLISLPSDDSTEEVFNRMLALVHPSGIEGLIVLARGPRYSASGFPA
jgi:hypothetical protein